MFLVNFVRSISFKVSFAISQTFRHEEIPILSKNFVDQEEGGKGIFGLSFAVEGRSISCWWLSTRLSSVFLRFHVRLYIQSFWKALSAWSCCVASLARFDHRLQLAILRHDIMASLTSMDRNGEVKRSLLHYPELARRAFNCRYWNRGHLTWSLDGQAKAKEITGPSSETGKKNFQKIQGKRLRKERQTCMSKRGRLKKWFRTHSGLGTTRRSLPMIWSLNESFQKKRTKDQERNSPAFEKDLFWKWSWTHSLNLSIRQALPHRGSDPL